MGFGNIFTTICEQASVPSCAVVGAITVIAGSHGIEADCYARPFGLANTIIFQGAASFMHIGALVMTVIMILHVRSKFTAVGTLLYYGRLPIGVGCCANVIILQAEKKSPSSSTYICF